MEYEVSCGGVVFTRKNDEILYVIVQSLEGYWGFPKGHVEDNEIEEETAVREIYEETRLKVKIMKGFKTVDEHPIAKKEGLVKRIIYFAAEYRDQEIYYQREELRCACLMTYDEAMNAFQFESSKRILRETGNFLKGIVE